MKETMENSDPKRTYDLTELLTIFNDHVQQYEQMDNYDPKLFNLPKAFRAIVEEIDALKDRVKILEAWEDD